MYVSTMKGRKHTRGKVITVRETVTKSVTSAPCLNSRPTSLKQVLKRHDLAAVKRIPEMSDT